MIALNPCVVVVISVLRCFSPLFVTVSGNMACFPCFSVTFLTSIKYLYPPFSASISMRLLYISNSLFIITNPERDGIIPFFIASMKSVLVSVAFIPAHVLFISIISQVYLVFLFGLFELDK